METVMIDIDIIIPAHEKDINTLELCISGAKQNIKGVKNVYVISKDKLTESAIWYPESKLPFSIKDVAKKIGAHWRTSWYYADLLEGCSSIYVDGPSDYTLILDSDTIFLRPVSLIWENARGDRKVFLNTSSSDGTMAYLEHIHKLIPETTYLNEVEHQMLYNMQLLQISGVTHWILQEKYIVQEMIDRVEKYHNKPFWEAALDTTCQDYQSLPHDNNHETCPGKMASFELYFTYLLRFHRNKAIIRNLNSILAYKGSLGYPGYERSELSRTNTEGKKDILNDEENLELASTDFSSLPQAIEYVCNICRKKEWDTVTFQDHFWKEMDNYKDILNKYGKENCIQG